jgi:hypothetical protein
VPDTESAESVAATDAAAAARAAPWTGDTKERLLMIHPEIRAALVRERTRTFLAEADARGGGVDIARYVRDRENPCAAEIARP